MKKSLKKWQKFTILGLTLFLAVGLINVGVGSVRVQANNTAQTLPFSQNWSNAGLITTSDDWSAVPGIVGFRGDDAAITTADIDPRTILADRSTPVNVLANQTSPDTVTTGAVAEFDTLANPTVGLQGSGTADAPHIVIYLNTTGRSGITFACNIRDIDGSADDAVQQVDVQYRVGGTGNYASVPGGYIADATTAATATKVTPLSLTLPAAADNKALVEVRVITTNATGSDEWVGVDDISVSTGGTTPAAKSTYLDFTGNGRTDWATLAIPTSGPITWKIAGNPASSVPNQAFIRIFPYGLSNISTTTGAQLGDIPVARDYSGDNKTEVSVWRPGSQGFFYTSQFPIGPGPLSIERSLPFGTTSDNPEASGDYDNDGKIDYTVVRFNNTTGVLTWYIINSSNNTMRAVSLGLPASALLYVAIQGADFNGDGKDELVLGTLSGDCQPGATGICLVTYYANDSVNGTGVFTRPFGNYNSDYSITPADYTGDKIADLVAVRQTSGGQIWYINNSATNTTTATNFGIPDTTARFDIQVRGDYDGDGRQDIAVWRRSNQTFYYISSAAPGTIGGQKWGDAGDTPLAAFGIF